MCGIAGIADPSASTSEAQLLDLVGSMARRLAHRGPDAQGIWADPTVGLGFGHRRLAIVDLSSAGAQPMASADGRWVLSYNGELYNAPALRASLAPHSFRGHSDTEVLVEAMARWGLDEALVKANGMFALSAWDRETRQLHLARDRMGEKPLAYGFFDRRLVFCSELAALSVLPGWPPALDMDSIAEYLAQGYVAAPRSIFRGIAKVRPGHVVTWRAGSMDTTERAYWSDFEALDRGLALRSRRLEDRQAELESTLRDAVEGRLISDVPIGSFLSGGIDSTLVTALMQDAVLSRGGGPVRTFSIGFDEVAFDESPWAAAVARHLGTRHTEHKISAAAAAKELPDALSHWDEPFADSSHLPTWLLSRETRRDVTVVLTGDGGDELFAGYDRYRAFQSIWPRLARFPPPVRRAAASAVLAVPAARWTALNHAAARVVPRLGRARPGDKLHRLARMASSASAADAYKHTVGRWIDPSGLLNDGSLQRNVLDLDRPRHRDLVDHFQLVDQLGYLPDDLLVKVDRATMSFGLESRAPLLDHRVIEAAWSFGPEERFGEGGGKLPLRRLLAKLVPRELWDRPKQGFAIPLGPWLAGSLRPWVEDLLSQSSLGQVGFLRPEPIRALWSTHKARADDWDGAYRLWTVVALLAWLEALGTS